MRRNVWLVAVACVATTAVAVPAAAQEPGCCGPVIVYGAAPLPPVPPTGYVLDPSDARPPIYVVNQGPLYTGPAIYAVPTYSEGGYAYSYRGPYPYVHRPLPVWGAYPYVDSTARYGGSYIRASYRPQGVPPYGAYAYRAQPGALVIRVQDQGEPRR